MYIIKVKSIKHYTKEMLKLMAVLIIGMISIIAILFFQYKPIYQVTLNDEVIGYVENSSEFDELIQQEIINQTGNNIAFVTLDVSLEYEFKFVKNTQDTNEGEILEKLKEMSNTTYVTYAIILNEENRQYVDSIAEAESIVEEIKEKYEQELDFTIAIEEVYTDNLEELQISTIETAKNNIDEELEEEIKIEDSTINGVVLASVPVTGRISSRYGETSGRSGGHCGLDIAASLGTFIYACGDGTVIQSGWYGGYGNLVIIDHGNGVQTYYGHCSKLLVEKGEVVTSGQNIALVGSTGDSTGPHLHLEIRVNGTRINPQLYFYK